MIEARQGPLLVRCRKDGQDIFALSDPDVLNNHGLRLGDNAAFARTLVNDLADGAPVLLDTYDFLVIDREREPYKKREWSDLLRFFEWPLTLLWVCGCRFAGAGPVARRDALWPGVSPVR